MKKKPQNKEQHRELIRQGYTVREGKVGVTVFRPGAFAGGGDVSAEWGRLA